MAESRSQILGLLSQTTSLVIIPRVITAPAKELIAVIKIKKRRKNKHPLD